MQTLLDLLDESTARYGDRPALGLRRDDGTSDVWSFRELNRRSQLVAWRLRAAGLQPGDRILTWSPSTPELPATYFGAMRASVIIVTRLTQPSTARNAKVKVVYAGAFVLFTKSERYQ